jgi:hypothetical protein
LVTPNKIKIKLVLALGTLYSLIFCFLKVDYGIVFGITPYITFGVRQLTNRRVTPNGEEIKDKKWSMFLGLPDSNPDSLERGMDPDSKYFFKTG